MFDWNWVLLNNTPSTAHWKAYDRLSIRRNWTFFAISYGWDVISRNLSKLAFFEGGGSLWAQISDRRGHHPAATIGVRKPEWLPFLGIKICAVYCLVLSQTDRQNYDSQDCTSIAARMVKMLIMKWKRKQMSSQMRNGNCCRYWMRLVVFWQIVYYPLCCCHVSGSQHTYKELLLDALDYHTRSKLCSLLML